MSAALTALSQEIAACRICRDTPRGAPLPHEPNPVCVLSGNARIAICGQAPGVRVHASGKPFTDPSGDRLRSWMGVDETIFYDPARIAIVPMGFCFPGHDAKGGDLPPRRECREHWHDRIFAAMPQLELFILVGQYALDYHLGTRKHATLTDTVAAWRDYMTGSRLVFAMPHPSWRNNGWLRKNPWFEAELLPVLQNEIRTRI